MAEGVLLQQLQFGTAITVPAVAALLETCIDGWNEEVEKLQADVAAARLRKQQEVEELGGSLEEEPATSSSPLRSINVQRTQNAIYKHAQWFLRKFDFQVARLSKPGKHLSMADPRIVAVKEYVKAEVTITGLCIRSWLETSTRSGRPCTNQPGGSFGRTPGSRAPRRTSAWTLASSIVDANWRRVCRPAWGSRFQPCNPGSCVLFR